MHINDSTATNAHQIKCQNEIDYPSAKNMFNPKNNAKIGYIT